MILITKTVLEEETSLDTFHQKFELIRQINNFTLTLATHNSYSLSTTQRYDTDYDDVLVNQALSGCPNNIRKY